MILLGDQLVSCICAYALQVDRGEKEKDDFGTCSYTCVRDGCWWDMKDHVDAGVDRYAEVCSRYVFVERNLEGESVKVL